VEWVDALRGAVVALDTAPLIYFIEEHPDYLPRVQPFFEALDRGEFEVVTSTVTVTEVLVHPLRHGDAELAATYREVLLNAEHVRAVPVSAGIAEAAAALRAKHNLRTPDAIQAATALQEGATHLLTNDADLAVLAEPIALILDKLPR